MNDFTKIVKERLTFLAPSLALKEAQMNIKIRNCTLF